MAGTFFNSNLNPSTTFFLKLAAFIFLFFIVDQLLGVSLDSWHKRTPYGGIGVINKAIEERADILIVGASRAKHHYLPEIISQNLNMSCYNLGADGTNVIYHYSLISHILKHYKPKIIIYDFFGQEFDKQIDSSARYAILLPIIKQNKAAINIIKNGDPYIKIKLISNMYPHNKYFYSIFPPKNELKFNGYEPLHGSQIEEILKTEKKKYYTSQDEVDSLKETFLLLTQEAKKAGVLMIFINSPQWKYMDGKRKYDMSQTVLGFIRENNMPFFIINDDTYPELNDVYLYKDLAHLNNEGAVIFSSIVNTILKKYTLQQGGLILEPVASL